MTPLRVYIGQVLTFQSPDGTRTNKVTVLGADGSMLHVRDQTGQQSMITMGITIELVPSPTAN